jgi:hypothetical protein
LSTQSGLPTGTSAAPKLKASAKRITGSDARNFQTTGRGDPDLSSGLLLSGLRTKTLDHRPDHGGMRFLLISAATDGSNADVASAMMTPRPFMADPKDFDAEDYRVIRASDGRPLAFIEKGLWKQDQETLARLFIASSDLIALVDELVKATWLGKDKGFRPLRTGQEWINWRKRATSILDELEDHDETER